MSPAGSGQGAGRRPLGQLLKARGVVREGQIQEALAEQRKSGGLIGQILVELGHAKSSDIALALAEQAGMEIVDLSKGVPEKAALALVDGDTAHAFGVLPLAVQGRTLTVAIGDPLNTAVLEDLRFQTGLDVKGVIGDAELLRSRIREQYGEQGSISDAIAAASKAASGSDAASAAASMPVVRLLNSILHRAIRDRASDVHFEVYDGDFRIRYRVDGALYEVEAPPQHLAVPLVARIKVMSDLDIAETRMPQDGRIELSIDGRPVDLRVATLPGIAGEGCVLRVLDRSAVQLDLSVLGMNKEEEDLLRRLVALPHGIVLITGPTGSGKTTTLYAMLQEANEPGTKIITAEDPVEYDIDGIVQVPVNDEIGVTYAKVLRTMLRQDPDKILVGEIRDAETAQTAVEASLTGHTVLSTLHTNDAPSAVTRLVDIGVESFMITATLEAVIAQRLVRRICTNCRTSYQPDDEILRELGPDGEGLRGATFHYGRGCEQCHHTGYRGRTGLYEVMLMNDDLRRIVLANGSTAELRNAAIRSGMRPLRHAGLAALTEGRTTIEEVLRETFL
ncbi:MAG: pilus assembly protein PilB [Planctomycetes bacterium]|nr:pilus assembly protein PilB [Planctomycetota bacterium]